MARLFLTGASGFVGAATLREAVARGHEVFAAVRPGSAAPRLAALRGRFTPVPLDLRDHDTVAAAMMRHRPDAVVHLAWSGVGNGARHDRLQINDNLDAACALVEAAAAAGCQTILAVGSQGEYGPVGGVIGEEVLPQPTTLYGASKVAALYLTRQLAAQHGMRFAWLRLFSSFGPDDNPGWLIPMLINSLLAGQRPKLTLGTQFWDWLYIDDVAHGILAALEEPSAQGVFNLGSGQPVQVRTVVEAIRDLVAPGMGLLFGEVPFRPDQVMHMQADISRLSSATGWRPKVDIHEGLARTVAWHRDRLA